MDFIASGLRAEEMYSIAVRFVLVDKYRYNFSTALEEWQAVCEDRHQPGPSRCVEHPASPASGQNWNEKFVSFNELRLTNRATKSKNLVSVLNLWISESIPRGPVRFAFYRSSVTTEENLN